MCRVATLSMTPTYANSATTLSNTIASSRLASSPSRPSDMAACSSRSAIIRPHVTPTFSNASTPFGSSTLPISSKKPATFMLSWNCRLYPRISSPAGGAATSGEGGDGPGRASLSPSLGAGAPPAPWSKGTPRNLEMEARASSAEILPSKYSRVRPLATITFSMRPLYRDSSTSGWVPSGSEAYEE